MTTQFDAQIMLKKETTYTTAVTPDTAVEFTAEDLDYSIEFAQGAGMRVGQTTDYSNRRVKVKEEASGSFTIELQSKGNGKLIEAALGGTGTSTLIGGTGSSYQQLFTPTTTDYLSSYTIQKGIPPLGGGSTNPMTFDGMVCEGFELTAPNSGIPTLKFNWMGRALATDTSLATASYASGVKLLSFVHGAITIGGSVTVPTTTALGTGGTASAIVREASLTYSNGLDANGFNLGGAGKRTRKPALGKRAITGNLVVEYTDNTLRDAWINGTELALVLTFQDTTTAISGSNYPTFQITIPVIRLNGELPKVNGGDVVTQSVDFDGLDGGVASAPIYVAIVTAETAI